MGKQVSFYMTAQDERDFLGFVWSNGNVAVFKSIQESPHIVELHEMPKQGEDFWFSMCLWNRDVSPAPKLEYIEQQRYYSVDECESEVIQFHRCGFDDGRLVRGRIWAEMAYWRFDNPPVPVKKGLEFVKWYNRLASWIKRHSTRNSVGDYMMPGAVELDKSGGTLCEAVFGDGSAIGATPTEADIAEFEL